MTKGARSCSRSITLSLSGSFVCLIEQTKELDSSLIGLVMTFRYIKVVEQQSVVVAVVASFSSSTIALADLSLLS